MENVRKRISMPTQLVCALPPVACKVMQYMCGWSGQEFIKLYVHQMARAMNLVDEEVELAIQTLANVNLIEIGKQGDVFVAKINADQVQRYFEIPFQKIIEADGIKNATEITWNKVEEKKQSPSIDDMSDADMKRMLLMLQARLNEREQLKSKVVTAEPNKVDDGLPW